MRRLVASINALALVAACSRGDTARPTGDSVRGVRPLVGSRATATAPAASGGPARTAQYDGRWWARADGFARTMFVSGVVDCKSADAPGPPSFLARSFESYKDSVTVYYAADSARLPEPVTAIMTHFADRPGEHAPEGGETYPEPHGFFDAEYWRVAGAPGAEGEAARAAFVAGYLACREAFARSLADRYSRAPEDYRVLIDQWYGFDEQTDDVREDRDTVKIANALRRFADRP